MAGATVSVSQTQKRIGQRTWLALSAWGVARDLERDAGRYVVAVLGLREAGRLQEPDHPADDVGGVHQPDFSGMRRDLDADRRATA